MTSARASRLVGGGGKRVMRPAVRALLLAVGLSLMLCSSAMALSQRGHELELSFGKAGSGAGQLNEPKGVAINEATGDIYVVDSGNNRVDRFNAEGGFIEAWGWGVRNGEKLLQTCTPETTCRAGLKGHGKGELHGAEAIAIDNAPGSPSKGDVYVEAVKPYEETIGKEHEVEFERTVYDKFSPTGKLESQIKGWKEKGESTEPFEEPHGITVDHGGHVWIYNEESLFEFTSELKNKFVKEVESEAGEGRQGVAVNAAGDPYVEHEGGLPAIGEEPPSVVAKLDPTGEVLAEELNGEDSTDVAVDPSTQSVLVDDVDKINVFDPAGQLIDTFGTGQIGHGTGIAVAGTGESGASEVAVADSASNEVHLYEPEKPGAPQIGEVAVAGITSTSARLTALIDPTGSATEYSFRYSTGALPSPTETCSGACHETSEASIGSGFSDVSVEPEVSGLTPATTYHYQVIAHNSKGNLASAEQVFKTAPEVFGATLPDSRQWQLVSPPNKNGAVVPPLTAESEVVQASEDGSGLTYVTIGALPGAEGSRVPEPSQILSERGGDGWSSRDLDTPHEEAEGLVVGSAFEYRWFSSDLTKALVQPFGTAPGENPPLNKAASEHTPYVRENTSSACQASPVQEACFTPLVTANNVIETEIEGKKRPVPYGGRVNFVAATPDLSHSVLSSSAPLTAGAGKKGNLFVWAGGNLTLASVLPGGEAATSPALGADNANVRNAISADGSKVIFSAVSGTQTHLYVRDLTSGETAQIDEPEAGTEVPVGTPQPTFQTASADGSRIFFTDEQRLTKEATSSVKLARPDLYECVLGESETTHKLACTLHDLTVDAHAGESANVQGAVLGASTDGTTLYFVANGALTGDATPGNCRPGEESGNQGQFTLTAKCTLYRDHYDAGSETWSLTRVAELSAEDEPDWSWPPIGNLGRLTSRVSADGNWVTFMSDRSLTGYHNRDAVSGKLDEEVYSYEAATPTLRCLSCNPNGARPTGVFDSTSAETGEGVGILVDQPASYKERWLSGSIPGWTHMSISEAPYASRVLDDSGRVFFTSSEGLVPQDTNGKEDVYEYEPTGVGGCTSASETFQEANGGCVSLISSGKSSRESAFLDASPSGNDVFFVTASSLAPSDTDTAFDVYDASVCGVSGSPGCLPEPAATPKPCESVSECRTATNTPEAPEFPAGPTSNQGPSGNIVSTPKTSVLSATTEKAKTTTTVKKPLTRAQKLAAALKACHKLKKKSKRHACEVAAHKRYGPAHKASKAKHTATRSQVRR